MSKPNRSDGFMGAAARYTSVAMTLPGATIAGYFIGYGLDHWLGTTYLRIVFLILGIIGGFAELIRQLTRDMKDPRQMTTLPVDLSVTRITRFALALATAGVIAAWVVAGPREAAGFLVGAALSLITIRSWFKLAGNLGMDGSVPGGGAAVFLVLRYVLIAGAIYATIKVLKSSPAVLILGLLVSFAAVLLDLVFGLAAPKVSK